VTELRGEMSELEAKRRATAAEAASTTPPSVRSAKQEQLQVLLFYHDKNRSSD
jgi:hypothetical protein